MATSLENYYKLKYDFDSGLQTKMPGADQVWLHLELLYRIEVLEACLVFCKTAPRSAESKDLVWHYQSVDAYFEILTLERRNGAGADEHIAKQRETARDSLLRVIQDYRKRFASFTSMGDAELYHKTITNVIQTVVPVWMQYRQTYIEIKKEAAL